MLFIISRRVNLRRYFLVALIISPPFSFFSFSLVFQVGDSTGKVPTPIENKFSALNMDEENDD